MSNSNLISYTNLSPNNKGRRTVPIDRITPHCVVGQCTIEALGALFAQSSRKASSNYGIDKDGRIGMFVPEDSRAMTSSSSANDNRAVTIECASDTYAPYAFRGVVYESLVNLCIDICKRNGKTKLLWLGDKDTALAYTPAADEMVLTAHRWFGATGCPGDWMYSRMGELAERVTAALTPKESHWYDTAMSWVQHHGIMNDGRPNDTVTRAELATMLMRYHALFGEEDNRQDSGLLS